MTDEVEGNQQNPPPDVVLRVSSTPSTSQGIAEQLGTLSIAQRNSLTRRSYTQQESPETPSGCIVIPVGQGSSSYDQQSVCSSNFASTIRDSVRRQSNEDVIRFSLRERNAEMLFNESMADVHFIVGHEDYDGESKMERIPAHSYVLAIGSTVFEAMFYGNFDNAREIHLPDVDADALRIMLRYLYTDEVQLTAGTVLPTLYVARKYLLFALTNECLNFMQSTLTKDNVCSLLQQCTLFDDDELVKRCWELVDAQAEHVLRSEGFTELDFETFKKIISRDTLNASESAVFDAAVRWGKTKLRPNEEPTPQAIRQTLGDAFALLRIPTMRIEQFANGPAKSGLLTYEEITDVFLYFTAIEKPQLPYVYTPRIGLSLRAVHRFQSCAYRNNQWRYRGRCDSIQFTSDRRIFVSGLSFYGSSAGAATYAVRMSLRRKGVTLSEKVGHIQCDGSSSTFALHFDCPVMVEACTPYVAAAVLEGQELSYFGQEGLSEVPPESDGDAAFNFQVSPESTNGTGVQGGQIPEILYFCPA